MKLKTELNLTDRKFEVDLSHLAYGENKNTLHPEVLDTDGWLELPTGRGFLWLTTALPKGTFNYEIKLGVSKLTLEGDPIECEIHGSKRSSTGQFEVDGCRTEFNLFFNPSAIIDCPDTINVNCTYTLPFTLVLSNIEDSDDSKEFEDYLEITIKAFKPTPIFEFIPSKKKFVYSKGTDNYTQVGVLRISHNAPFKCAPDILKEKFYIQGVFKSQESDNTEGPEDFLRLIINNEKCIDGIIEHMSSKDNRFIEYPVYLDMQLIQNPQSVDSPDKYEVLIHFQEQLLNAGSFLIERNPHLTRLHAIASMPQQSGDILYKDISWNDGNAEDMGVLLLEDDQNTNIHLRFENTADADDRKRPHASVLVWGIKLTSVEALSNEDGILMKEGMTLSDLISCDVSENQKWSLKHHEHCEANITINGGNLLALRPSPTESETFAELLIEIEYHAVADKDGILYEDYLNDSFEDNEYLCKQSFTIKLKRMPRNEWLCVDFGTSAVVASFADSIWEEDPLIDLKSQKLHLLKQVYTDGEKAKIEVDDESDKLISSTVFFNHDSTSTDDIMTISNMPADYKNYKIWFSPSAKAVRPDYQLPCLKNIMGYKHLPNIFVDVVKGFKYYTHTNNSTSPVERTLVDKKGKITMEVDTVSQIVYKQLFSYYLSQRLKDANELEPRPFNKLVLSVPNTYTPLNTEAIRKLARKVIPDIFPEYLYTVSESDAVACYYLSQFSQFVQNSKDVDSEHLDRLSRHENVLIYDMGAGTLDLTWFEKKVESETTTVTVKGKMGVSKAGNYLDYVLASIIIQLYEKSLSNGQRKKSSKQVKYEELQDEDSQLLFLKEALILDYEESVNKKVSSKDRKALKEYVKELKKCLDYGHTKLNKLKVEGKDLKLCIDEETVDFKDITINDIVNHNDFKSFLKEITMNVLQNFACRFGTNEKIDIDVFVFSGRSTSLHAIRNSVKEHIKKIRTSDNDLLFADICGMRLTKDIRYDGNDNNPLKTVVTHGALAFANYMGNRQFIIKNSEPFFATYGIVLKWNNKTMEWIPLLGRGAEGMINDNGTFENEWNSDTVCADIDLVQSYSPNVIDDYKKHNFETISKLGELGGRKWIKLRLFTQYVEGKSSVLQYFRSHQDNNGVELNPHDDFNNETLRKSLWPVIFVKENKFK